MKKSIKILVQKLEEDKKEGILKGGFASIKGGFKALSEAFGDNTGCTNSGNCTGTTNISPCSNSGTCFA